MSTDSASIRIEGLDELKKQLRQFDARVQRNIVTAGIRAGAALVRTRAREKVARRTGRGRKGIKVSVKRMGHSVVAKVGFDRRVYYLRFLETGTVHMAAKPFLRPAIDENKDAIIDAIKAKMGERIAKELLK